MLFHFVLISGRVLSAVAGGKYMTRSPWRLDVDGGGGVERAGMYGGEVRRGERRGWGGRGYGRTGRAKDDDTFTNLLGHVMFM